MSLPPIVAKITADTTGLDKGLAGAEAKLAAFGKAGAIAGTVVAATAAGLAALTKASLANIDVLAKQARSLGLTVAAFQKMSLVAEEAGVESGKLTAMLGLMQRNIDGLVSGTAAQTEAFGKLGLAVADLQGLNPDEQFAKIAEKLDAIADPAAKTALAMDVFGRSGREAINMLSGYNDAVANAEEFQRRFGIAVGTDGALAVERANDAVGRLGMVFEGLGNRLAVMVAPAIEATANALIDVADVVLGAKTRVEEFFGSIENARAALGDEVFMSIFGRPDLITEASGALSDLSWQIQEFGRLGMEAGQEIGFFHQQLTTMGMLAEASAVQVLIDQMNEVRQKFADGTISAEEFLREMERLRKAALGIAESLDGVNGVSFGTVIASLGGLGDAILSAFGKAKSLRAEISAIDFQGMADDRGQAIADRRNAVGGGIGDTITTSPRPRAAPALLGEPGSVGGCGGGGGGGGANPRAQQLEALVQSLKTEQEIIDEWYVTSLEALNAASEAELAALGGKHEAMERLEREHQERLAGIRSAGDQNALTMVLGAGEEILNAVGQNNKKALKMAKVFGAAQALISTYQGAAEALKLPFPQNLSAAAAVIAKGVGFINAIKGVNESGGGGGAGGGAGAAASAAPPVQRMLIDYNGPASFKPTLSGLVDMINQAGKAGYVLNAEIMGAR